MRYQNWDVLLFPGQSRVPMQEFKTACYVVHDTEIVYDENFSVHGEIRQVPIVNCFLANLESGSPFKVSIHSWTPPEASESLRRVQNTSNNDKIACFEARVIIDGSSLGSVIIATMGQFPHIIEYSVLMSRDGMGRDPLRWPSFHREMLTQSYWNAGDNFGRIKVTISEGFIQRNRDSSFVRTRNVVTFAFQHVPQHDLENAQIAWPNKSMWMVTAPQLYNTASPDKQHMPIDPELHAHSPTRARVMDRNELPPLPQPNFPMAPPPLPTLLRGTTATIWAPDAGMQDPFVERRYAHRSDISMPDYSDSASEKASWQGGMDGTQFSTRNSSIHAAPASQSHDMKFEDMVNLTDSPTHPQSGVQPPTNSKASSAENTPFGKAARDQKQNYQSDTTTTSHRAPSQFEVRKDSDVTMKSHFSDLEPAEDRFGSHAVKGKKEGNNPRNDASSQPGLKRPEETLNLPDVLGATGLTDPKCKRVSGTRKVSKTENLDIPSPIVIQDGEDIENLDMKNETRKSSASAAIRAALTEITG